MKTRVLKNHKIAYIECLPEDWQLASETQALELVEQCFEHSVYRLLLPNECFPDKFFNLSSGVAGDVLLKLGNYGVRTAAVISTEQVGKGRFHEMVLELNRGSEFRVFSDYAAAVEWLTAA